MDYLDRIDKFIEITKNEKYHSAFFDSNLTNDQIINFYELGYWDHLLLGYDKSLRVYIAIRIVANLKAEQWPIVYIERKSNSVMMCSSLKALPIIELERLVNSKRLFETFNRVIENVKEVCKPIYTILNIEDSYFSYINYLSDKNNIPKSTRESNSLEEKEEACLIEYLKVYQFFDDSEGFKVFTNIVSKMIIDEDCVPDVPIKDYGVWTTRIFKTLGIRSYFSESKTNNRVLNLWKSFIEPHAYDPQTSSPGYYPKNSTDTHNFYDSILDEIDHCKNDFPKEIKEHPLFSVALGEGDAKISRSFGFATAAAVIDEQYNDPILVWKTLINASYYTSSVEQHVLLAKQAKALCERNGWQDAALAVERNIKVYQDIT